MTVAQTTRNKDRLSQYPCERMPTPATALQQGRGYSHRHGANNGENNPFRSGTVGIRKKKQLIRTATLGIRDKCFLICTVTVRIIEK
jgi:hypothetical protein